MKTLYEAANAVEAHMLLDLLRQEGIEARIEGEALQGAMGGVPAAGLVRLVVDEDSYGPARALIDRWEGTQIEPTPVDTATARSRAGWMFVLGLALGVGGTYAAYRAPMSADGTDYNRDGLLDEKWTYSPNGMPLRLEIDRNLDRRVDFVARYDARGHIASAESDDDFNGVFETRQEYRDGNLHVVESDTDGDGFPEMRSLYSYGVLERVEYLDPASGLPLRVEHQRLGRLDYADVDSDGDGKLDTRIKYTPLAEVASRTPLAK